MNKDQSQSLDWYSITAIINYLPQIARKDAYELIKVLMEEKPVTLNDNYTITHLKIGMNINLQDFYAEYL